MRIAAVGGMSFTLNRVRVSFVARMTLGSSFIIVACEGLYAMADQSKFDLGDAPDVTVSELEKTARTLEKVVESDADVSDEPDETLANFSAACKRLEDAAEEARKEIYEDELDGRVDDGESVGPLQKRTGSSTYVTDTEGAFAAVSGVGEDPLSVAKVSIGDLRDVLGNEADEYIGKSEYSYFARQ